jgi:hypothetical protein
MKLAALGASAIALTLALTPPAKALDNVTRDYVALSTAAIWVSAMKTLLEKLEEVREAMREDNGRASILLDAIIEELKAKKAADDETWDSEEPGELCQRAAGVAANHYPGRDRSFPRPARKMAVVCSN